jgi:activating signal cointegrator complex subunit 1
MPRYRARGYRANAGSSRTQQHRPALTHFLCLPLVTQISKPQLEASLVRFKDHISEINRTSVVKAIIPLQAVRPLGTLHLTLGVMSLEGDRVEQAMSHLQTLDLTKMLQDATPSTLSNGDGIRRPLSISLTSLVSMHDPESTSVLYAIPHDSTSRLHSFCEALRLSFAEEDFIVDESRPLKLHATVVNTVYSKSEVGTVKRLDASGILSQLQDFSWTSEFSIEKVAICKMGAKKLLDEAGNLLSEAYEEIAESTLPGLPNISTS